MHTNGMKDRDGKWQGRKLGNLRTEITSKASEAPPSLGEGSLRPTEKGAMGTPEG